MTKDEATEYRRSVAALIVAAMYTGYTPPEPPANDTDENRRDYERGLNMRRMRCAEHAFAQAAAMIPEAELHEGPVDDDGVALDERAFNRKCIHGKKQDEPCPECDERQN